MTEKRLSHLMTFPSLMWSGRGVTNQQKKIQILYVWNMFIKTAQIKKKHTIKFHVMVNGWMDFLHAYGWMHVTCVVEGAAKSSFFCK